MQRLSQSVPMYSTPIPALISLYKSVVDIEIVLPSDYAPQRAAARLVSKYPLIFFLLDEHNPADFGGMVDQYLNFVTQTS